MLGRSLTPQLAALLDRVVMRSDSPARCCEGCGRDADFGRVVHAACVDDLIESALTDG